MEREGATRPLGTPISSPGAPSAAAAAEQQEKIDEWASDMVNRPRIETGFHLNEEVEIREEAPYQVAGGVADARGRTGRVAAQPYVAGDESAHAGKTCRAVIMDDSGELICTAERNLASRTHAVSRPSTAAYRAAWDRIFDDRI